MASSQDTKERHTFTVKDVNVHRLLEDKDNKSKYLRDLLRGEVYGEANKPGEIDDSLWQTYLRTATLFGENRHYEIDAVVAGVAAEMNKPSEVIRRRIKRCVSLGLMERHTGISMVTVAAKPRSEIDLGGVEQ